jgi:hypothetical protein
MKTRYDQLQAADTFRDTERRLRAKLAASEERVRVLEGLNPDDASEERVRVLSKALADCMEALESLDPGCLGFAYDAQSGGISWPIRDELMHRARQALGDSHE